MHKLPPSQGNSSHMKVPKCHYTHTQGDDGNAWTLPYFPPTMTTEGWDADCIQCMMMTLSRLSNLAVLLTTASPFPDGILPCPGSALLNHTSGPSSAESDLTDEQIPDGKIASWGVETLSQFGREGIGRKGANKPFFLAVGIHKVTTSLWFARAILLPLSLIALSGARSPTCRTLCRPSITISTRMWAQSRSHPIRTSLQTSRP